MKNEISEWNGYPVLGDVAELDGIIEASGFMKLDKDDIETVLSSEGENHLAVGKGATPDEAFNAAVSNLNCKVEKIKSLLIDIRCGNVQPKMSELSAVTASFSDANPDIEITWGTSTDEMLGDSIKVILLASVKA